MNEGMTGMTGFTVGQAARQLGRSEQWLRSAEAKGRIPKARRDLNDWRIYTAEDIARLRQLLVPQREGDPSSKPVNSVDPTDKAIESSND